MIFYIIRHGDKEKGDFRNPDLPLNDQPISELGQAQARALCDFFADRQIAHIYVSAYQRTGQTIAYVADQFKLTPVVDQRLNEINIGAFEGLSKDEVQENFPTEWQAYHERRSDFRFPKGESLDEARERAVEFLEEKREIHGDESVIAVCHDGLLRTLMCHVLGILVNKRWGFRADTCGITEIEFESEYGTWKLIRYNQSCS